MISPPLRSLAPVMMRAMGIATRHVWIGAATLFVAATGGAYWYSYHGILATEPFDPVRWRAPMSYPGDPVCHRGRMIADVQRKVLLPQAARSVVEDALGPPDVIDDNGGRSYHLGRCLGPRTRLNVLYLYFGMGERLNQATVMYY